MSSKAVSAARFGEARMVASDVEQSSMGHAIASSRPLSYRRTPLANFIGGIKAYRGNGTPEDCIALGVHNWDGVAAVQSGINFGTNLAARCDTRARWPRQSRRRCSGPVHRVQHADDGDRA